MKNVIAVNVGSYRKFRDTAFAHLQRIGIKHVEIPVPKPEEVDKVMAELDRYGLTATSLMGWCDMKNENVVQDMKPQLLAAARMNVRIIFISVHAGEIPKEVVFERLRKIGNLAAPSGVILSMETHPDLCHNGDVALETMRTINHPNIRINFDTANVYYYNEGVDGVAELKKIAHFVASVHLKDTNGGYRTWYFPTLGEGIVNFREVFHILNARQMFGPFTMELEGIEGENLTKEQTEERVAKSLEYLRRIGVAG